MPETHNLLTLARNAGLKPDEDQKESLNRLMVLRVNLENPDWRRKFRPAMRTWHAERQAAAIRELREWLLSLLSK